MDSRSGTSAEAKTTRWVFIRGLVRESAHWGDFPQRFTAGIPGAVADCLDLPGNGRYWSRESPLSIRETMESVRGEWRAADRGVAYLFTISLGSMVAIEWVSRYPEEIGGAVLINTSVRGISPLRRRLRWQVWPEFMGALVQRDVETRERCIVALTSARSDDSERQAVARVWARIFRDHPVRWANAARQLFAAARYAPPPGRPRVPVLLLSSRGDRLVDPRCTQDLAAAWKLQPQFHPWAGHELTLDDPDWTIQQVRAWLQGPAGRARAWPAPGEMPR